MNKRKREGYISWDEYFMASAALAAQRSKDPTTQVGACVVNSENKIVGLGYNSFPTGCNDDDFSWASITQNSEDHKHFYVCHAELNAIMNKNSANLEKCRIYSTQFPCNECAKLIIQAGIRKVIYLYDKYPENKAAKKMFDHAGVIFSQYVLTEKKRKRITIDFDQIISMGNRNNKQNTEDNQQDQLVNRSNNQPGTSQN